MDGVRDLAQAEPWLESLERSRARRAEKPRRGWGRSRPTQNGHQTTPPAPERTRARTPAPPAKPERTRARTPAPPSKPERTRAHTPAPRAKPERTRARTPAPERIVPPPRPTVRLRPTVKPRPEPPAPAAEPVATIAPPAPPAAEPLATTLAPPARPAVAARATPAPMPRPARQIDWRRFGKRSMTVVFAAVAVFGLVLLATAVPSLMTGHGSPPPKASAAAPVSSAAVLAPTATSHAALVAAHRGPPSAAPASGGRPDCERVKKSPGYVNPLAVARVTPERIDQGVDYAGVGALGAIGDGKITELAMDNTGWPGAFIVYRLTSGAGAGCLIYYAEGVQPVRGLHVGDTVRAGQAIASIIPQTTTGIEIGWAAPGRNNVSWAKTHREWRYEDDANSVPSAAGKSFSALIHSLGGPPGKIEGGRVLVGSVPGAQ